MAGDRGRGAGEGRSRAPQPGGLPTPQPCPPVEQVPAGLLRGRNKPWGLQKWLRAPRGPPVWTGPELQHHQAAVHLPEEPQAPSPAARARRWEEGSSEAWARGRRQTREEWGGTQVRQTGALGKEEQVRPGQGDQARSADGQADGKPPPGPCWRDGALQAVQPL